MITRFATRLRRLRRASGRTALIVRLFAHARHGSDGSDGSDGNRGQCSGERATGHRRGLVVVQIDGLSHTELERALRAGKMPMLARLIQTEAYRLHRFYSALPSSTPALQGELFYGVRAAVPASAWRTKDCDELYCMHDPACAKAIEKRLAQQGEALLAQGSAYCDIYTGDADEAHFCVASRGWNDLLQQAKPYAWAIVAVMHFPTLVRTAVLATWEFMCAIGDAALCVFRGQVAHGAFRLAAARVATVVLLRDLITIGAQVDIARGLAIVHLNYLGYDEQAHRHGPDSGIAQRALRGIDRRIATLWKAVHLAEHRHYDLWIYGGHGQTRCEPYEQFAGTAIESAIESAIEAAIEAAPPSRPDSPRDFRSASVVGAGSIAHVLLPDTHRSNPAALEHVVWHLVDRTHVPAVLFQRADGGVHARTRESLLELPRDAGALLGDDHPALPDIADDLVNLVMHPDAGDLVLLGWVKGCRSLSFADERGTHAGVTPEETVSFALLPVDALAGVGIESRKDLSMLRPDLLRNAALNTLGRTAPSSGATVPNENSRRSGRSGTSGQENRDVRRLRVMSYNVHGCVGMDGRLAPERIARVIARQAPDVVALQELDAGRSRSDHLDQAAVIAGLLEMGHRFHPAIHVEEERYGNAILTRLPVLDHRDGLLPAPHGRQGLEPRGVLWVTLELGRASVQVLVTHFGLQPAERRVQVADMLSARWLAHPDCRGPTILCGDLNTTPRSPTLRRFGSAMYDVRFSAAAGRLATFPANYPVLAIDHVLTRDVCGVEKVAVPRTELERMASDHLPLLVDLVL